MFFTEEQKEFAKQYSKNEIKSLYKRTEKNLNLSAKKGSIIDLVDNMSKHQLAEYALLYQNTPEYKEFIRSKRK